MAHCRHRRGEEVSSPTGRPDRERIARAIDAIPAGDVKPLVGLAGEWRLRVGGWRVRYRRDDIERVLTILVVAPRGDVYKR